MSYLVALHCIILITITGCFSTNQDLTSQRESSSDVSELSSVGLSSEQAQESSESLLSDQSSDLSQEQSSYASSLDGSSEEITLWIPENRITECRDGLDNDGDGDIDCDDLECNDFIWCFAVDENYSSERDDLSSSTREYVSNSDSASDTLEVVCDDMIDNERDGWMDCADPDCAEDPVCHIAPETHLYHIDYEDGLMQSERLGLGYDTTKEYGATLEESIVRSGKYSARFEVRSGDNMVFNGTRSENDALDVDGTMFTEGDSLSYRMSVYIPEGWVNDGANEDIIFQWKMTGVGGGPHIFFGIKHDLFVVRHNYDDFKGQETVMPFVEGVWNDFVFNIIWSSSADGAFTVWHKRETEYGYTKVLEKLDLPTLYSLASDRKNYIKWGLYCPKWNERETAADSRVVYFDNVIIGKDFDVVQSEIIQ
ncbi:MAG: heparin lyase I family protein [Fibrobacterales bacterium]